MPGSKDIQGDAKSCRDLSATIETTASLLQTFLSSLKPRGWIDAADVSEDSPDPLDVFHTSATLLKAHTTKLSLLTINKPFTPSAIRREISEIAGTCVPAMMSAVETCRPEIYGRILHEEAKYIVRTIFKELHQMLEKLQHLLKATPNPDDRSRDSLVSTGVLWASCDELIELKRIDLPGLVVRKALLLKETLEDEIKELQEWGTLDSDDEDDDGEENEENSNDDADSLDSVERMFGSGDKIPNDRPDLRATLDSSLSVLKLVKSMYDAATKYRFKALKSKPGSILQSFRIKGDTVDDEQSIVQRVDDVMDVLRQIPDDVAELAGSLYEHDDDQAQKLLWQVSDQAKTVESLLNVGWLNEVDEFPKFASVWLKLIDQS